jgi:hypothetical protein
MTARTRSTGPGIVSEENVIWSLGQYDLFATAEVSEGRHVMTGEDIPHFHKRVRSGELLQHTAFNDFTVNSRITGTQYDASITGSNPVVSTYLKSGVFMYTPFSEWTIGKPELLDIANSYNYDKLVQGAAAKIYSKGHDTLTFLAELKKTFRLFTHAQSSLKKLLKAATKNGKVSDIQAYGLNIGTGGVFFIMTSWNLAKS